MRSSLRVLAQLIVVRTSFFPLTLLYGTAYALSVKVATALLSRIDGVAAIYLRRGLAKGEVVYGLSDIDLSVIVDDGIAGERETRERVRAIYDRLARFIPLFGDSATELGVYSESEFAGLYEDYDFHKYRFNEGRHTWRLLFGRDVVGDLPQFDESGLYLPAGEELKKWWSLLIDELFGDGGRRSFESKYLWYKAIAEASKVYLHVCHGAMTLSRDEALDNVRAHLSSEDGLLVDQVRGYVRRLAAGGETPQDELARLFISLAGRSFVEIDRKAFASSPSRPVAAMMPDPEGLPIKGGRRGLLEALAQAAGEELGPDIDSLALVPQFELSLDVLSNSDIDALCLVLERSNPTPLGKLRRLVSLLQDHRSATDVVPFVVADSGIAFSLRAEADHSGVEIKSPGTCPLFFAMLDHGLSRLPGMNGTGSDRLVRCHLPPGIFEEPIRKRQARIDAVLSSRDIYKMRTLDFLRFFWGAARSKLAAQSLQLDETIIPLTSRQIVEQLEERFPGDSGWLNDLHGEYVREVRGEENGAYRFFSRSIELLGRI